MSTQNPFQQPSQQWLLRFSVAAEMVTALEQAFATDGVLAISSFEVDETRNLWSVELICQSLPDKQEITRRLAVIAALTGEQVLFPTISKLQAKDWQSEVEKNFPPLAVGRFFVYGSHYDGKIPAGAIPLLVNAGAAFGSGEHATTSGCLEALAVLAARRSKRRGFTNMLDMGCGTAILAIAMVKLWHKPALAVDIDAVSVRVARTNCRINKVQNMVRVAVSNGYTNPLIKRRAPYDLIIANILARPLTQMAKYLRRNLSPDGVAVLSGLLARQEEMVLSAHRMQGLHLQQRIVKDGWYTLIVGR